MLVSGFSQGAPGPQSRRAHGCVRLSPSLCLSGRTFVVRKWLTHHGGCVRRLEAQGLREAGSCRLISQGEGSRHTVVPAPALRRRSGGSSFLLPFGPAQAPRGLNYTATLPVWCRVCWGRRSVLWKPSDVPRNGVSSRHPEAGQGRLGTHEVNRGRHGASRVGISSRGARGGPCVQSDGHDQPGGRGLRASRSEDGISGHSRPAGLLLYLVSFSNVGGVLTCASQPAVC